MDCFGNYLGNGISGTSTDAGTGTTISCTDEDSNNIMLASSHPKKRTGRKKFKETRHPVYRGVRMRNSNRWVCEVREPGKRNRIWLGTYPTPEMAARAHDVAAIALRGLSSCLNFADSAWRLPKPASTDPEDIQRAAAEAAEMFNTENQEDEEEEEEEEKAAVNNQEMTGVAGQSNGEKSSMSLTNYETQSHHQQSSKFYYMDDEAIFDMPGLLNDMAEGLLLPPPSYHLDSDFEWDDDNADDQDMMLWNHSV